LDNRAQRPKWLNEQEGMGVDSRAGRIREGLH